MGDFNVFSDEPVIGFFVPGLRRSSVLLKVIPWYRLQAVKKMGLSVMGA